jgi:hypothetical protein
MHSTGIRIFFLMIYLIEKEKKYFTNERGNINIYYHYDEKNRLKEKIRVVKTDTVNHSKYHFKKKISF